MSPESGLSKPPNKFNNVDLPLPEGPKIHARPVSGKVPVKFLTAWTFSPPVS